MVTVLLKEFKVTIGKLGMLMAGLLSSCFKIFTEINKSLIEFKDWS